jgi:hypothetical protein
MPAVSPVMPKKNLVICVCAGTVTVISMVTFSPGATSNCVCPVYPSASSSGTPSGCPFTVTVHGSGGLVFIGEASGPGNRALPAAAGIPAAPDVPPSATGTATAAATMAAPHVTATAARRRRTRTATSAAPNPGTLARAAVAASCRRSSASSVRIG